MCQRETRSRIWSSWSAIDVFTPRRLVKGGRARHRGAPCGDVVDSKRRRSVFHSHQSHTQMLSDVSSVTIRARDDDTYASRQCDYRRVFAASSVA